MAVQTEFSFQAQLGLSPHLVHNKRLHHVGVRSQLLLRLDGPVDEPAVVPAAQILKLQVLVHLRGVSGGRGQFVLSELRQHCQCPQSLLPLFHPPSPLLPKLI